MKNEKRMGRLAAGYRAGGSVMAPEQSGVGPYWSRSNAEFEATNPNFLQRMARAISPATGLGSAIGGMHDAASEGDRGGMALAALQGVPTFAALKAVKPGLLSKALPYAAPSGAATAGLAGANATVGASIDAAQRPADPSAPSRLAYDRLVANALGPTAKMITQPANEAPVPMGYEKGGTPMKPLVKEVEGRVAGPAGEDRVPAWLTEGEVVMPVETVRAFGGPAVLEKIIEATSGRKPGGKPVARDNSIFKGAHQRRLIDAAPKGGPVPEPGHPLSFERVMGLNSGGRIHESIPERKGPVPKRADKAPVGQGLLRDAMNALISGRDRTEQVDKMVKGYVGGGAAWAAKNEERAQRMGGQGMYGGANSDLVADTKNAFSFPEAAKSFNQSGSQIKGAYNTGGLPAAAGATVRTALDTPMGIARDVGNKFSGVENALMQDRSVQAAAGGITDVARRWANKQVNDATRMAGGLGTATRAAATGNFTPVGSAPTAASIAGAYKDPSRRLDVMPAPRNVAGAPALSSAIPRAFRDADEASMRAPGARNVPGADGVIRYESADPNQGPLYSNVGGGQMQGGGVSTVASDGYGGRLSFDSLQRTAAMNSENNRIRQNRLDGRADDWTPTRTTSEDQSRIYQQNKAAEDADRTRFFAQGRFENALAGLPSGPRASAARATLQNKRFDAEQGSIIARMREQGEAARTGMRDAGETARANLREQGEMQRAGMAQSVGLANAATGAREADTRGRLAEGEIAERSLVSSLRNQYLNEQDPAKREQLGRSLMTLQGREPQQDRFTVVPGGQEWDTAAGAMRNVPSRVLNNQTGQFVEQPGGGGGAISIVTRVLPPSVTIQA